MFSYKVADDFKFIKEYLSIDRDIYLNEYEKYKDIYEKVANGEYEEEQFYQEYFYPQIFWEIKYKPISIMFHKFKRKFIGDIDDKYFEEFMDHIKDYAEPAYVSNPLIYITDNFINYISHIEKELDFRLDFDVNPFENEYIIAYLRHIQEFICTYADDEWTDLEITIKKRCIKSINKFLLFIKSKIKNNKSKEYINKIIEALKFDLQNDYLSFIKTKLVDEKYEKYINNAITFMNTNFDIKKIIDDFINYLTTCNDNLTVEENEEYNIFDSDEVDNEIDYFIFFKEKDITDYFDKEDRNQDDKNA